MNVITHKSVENIVENRCLMNKIHDMRYMNNIKI